MFKTLLLTLLFAISYLSSIITCLKLRSSTKLETSLKSGLEGLLNLKTRRDVFGDDSSKENVSSYSNSEVESLIQRNEDYLKNNNN